MTLAIGVRRVMACNGRRCAYCRGCVRSSSDRDGRRRSVTLQRVVSGVSLLRRALGSGTLQT
jgi:hypothetical protein